MAPQANGKAFLGLINYLKEHYGAAAVDAVVAAAPPETKTVFANRISISQWYSYEAFTGFLGAIAQLYGHADPHFFQTVGENSGKRDLGTIYKIYKNLASSERLIRSCSGIWTSYYREAGEMTAVSWKPDNTVLRIMNFPGMSPLHCQLMVGWMASTMKELGIKFIEFSERACTSKGAPHHEFFARWQS
jgi:hypothetical protein